MAIDIPPYSRFINTETVNLGGFESFGVWNVPNFLKQSLLADQEVVIKITAAYEGRLDLIAHELYGTPFLDWVIIAYNNILEPLNWPRAGTVIKIPVRSVILDQLS